MPEARGARVTGDGEHAGVYRYRVTDGSWWWSDEMYALHGLTPDATEPSTALLLAQRHPDDRDHVRKVFEACVADGEPFSCYHRVVDPAGRELRMVLTGDGEHGDDGHLVAVRGFCIDLTGPVTRDIRDISDQTIAAARDSQAVVDQARGIIMATYGVDAGTAFALLRRHSQHTNTKLRDVARSLVEAAPAPPGSFRTELRRRLERVLYPGDPSASPSH